jgi:putative ABC transport system permease protein
MAPVHGGSRLYWNDFGRGWRSSSFYVYLKLSPGSSARQLESKLDRFLGDRMDRGSWKNHLLLQKLTRIHLHSHMPDEIEPNSHPDRIYLLIVVCILILSIACINHVNLTTARAVTRAKEVGIRKVTGARQDQLVKQFLGESVLLSLLAFPAAMVLAQFLMPVFNRIVHRDLHLLHSGDSVFLLVILGLVIGVGLVSGIYPAVVMASYTPVRTLTRLKRTGPARSFSRNLLVILQFSVSSIFIILTWLVSQQMKYIQSESGFESADVLVIPVKDYQIGQSYPVLKTELLQEPDISSITASSALPSQVRSKHPIYEENGSGGGNAVDWIGVDFGFLETFGIEVADGRGFSVENASDATSAYIVNETAVKAFGWGEPVGRQFQMSNERLKTPIFHKGKIIGVVKDFHFQTMHQEIEPLVIKIYPKNIRYISMKIQSDDIRTSLSSIRARWQKIFPDRPFEHFFLQDQFKTLYRKEAEIQVIFRYSALLAIVIASMGVIGLVSFKTERRQKEIGMRKVLGASASRLVVTMGWDFIRLVLVSNVIAWPVAYLLSRQWLSGFAYRTGLNGVPFLAAAMITLFLAFLTIVYQIVQTSRTVPVEVLRNE